MTTGESLTFPGFEDLIYVCDTSALVNLKISRNVRELREFAYHYSGRVRIPQPIGKEVSRQDDDLRSWWLRNQALLIARFHLGREHELHQQIAIKYAREPFHKEGKTYARLSDADTYAAVIAIARHWTLVTDEESMKAVCRQNEYKANYISSSQFKKVIGVSSFE